MCLILTNTRSAAFWAGFFSEVEEMTDNDSSYLKQQRPLGVEGQALERQQNSVSRNKRSEWCHTLTVWWLQLESIVLLFKCERHCIVVFHNHAHLTSLILPGRLFKYLSVKGVFAIILSPEKAQPIELRMVFAANSPFSKWIPICGGRRLHCRNFRKG